FIRRLLSLYSTHLCRITACTNIIIQSRHYPYPSNCVRVETLPSHSHPEEKDHRRNSRDQDQETISHGGVPPGRPGVINLHADVFSLRCRYLRKVKQRQRCVQERKKYRTDPGLKSTSLKCEA